MCNIIYQEIFIFANSIDAMLYHLERNVLNIAAG